MKRLLLAWRRRPIIMSGFILAVVFTGLFAFRSVAVMIYWSEPDRKDQAIEGWMTPRYVAQSWHLPPHVMYEALHTDEMPNRRQTLHDIARTQDTSIDDLAGRIAAAAKTYRDTQE
jgi:hypothetical protein